MINYILDRTGRGESWLFYLNMIAFLATYALQITFLASSSIMRTETVSFFETSVKFHRPARRHNPEDNIFHSHHCERLRWNHHYLESNSQQIKANKLPISSGFATLDASSKCHNRLQIKLKLHSTQNFLSLLQFYQTR